MDKRAMTIVTGGSRGIGRAIARRMARETAVMVVSRNERDLAAVCEEINAAGGIATYCVGDVTAPDTADRTLLACNGYEIRNLVCNAGDGRSKKLHEFEDDEWRKIMDVNVFGTFKFCKTFIPPMLAAKRGTICIMSSISGLTASRLNTPYTAAKHALVGMAKDMAKDYGEDGIVTVAICPGYVETDMTERSIAKRMDRGMTRDQAIEKIARTNPQHRIIPPSEIAEEVAHVCSGLVRSLSGSAIVLSGGV